MSSGTTLAQPLLGNGHAHEENGGHGHSHGHDEEHGHGHGHGHDQGHGHDEEKGGGHGSTHGHSHDHEHGHKEGNGHGHCDSSSDEGSPEDMHARDKRKLRFAVYCALFFMFVELIGGMIANSLAIMADAAHMLSDVGGFAVSIFALSFSEKIPDINYSYGYKQVEVFGACISMMVVWGLSFVLLSEAIPRFIHPQHVDAPMMCVVSIVGFIVNVVLMKVLGHDYGDEGHGHGHGHSHGHSHGHGHGEEDGSTALQAAVAHVIGDMLMSLGVLFAAVVMWVRPFDDYIGETEDGVSRWNYMDPLCTVFFSILVLWTTVPTLMRALRILMGGAPRNIDVEKLRGELTAIPHVTQVHDLHVWSFGSKEVLCTAHLGVSGRDNADPALKKAIKIAEKYKAFHSTFQIELEGEFDQGSPAHLNRMESDCYCSARGR